MTTKTMTPEEKRIRIAELCGWEVDPELEDGALMGMFPAKGGVMGWDMVPDYLNDLNAMHEAAKTLTEDQRELYYRAVSELSEYWPAIDATAEQRAEAFLRIHE